MDAITKGPERDWGGAGLRRSEGNGLPRLLRSLAMTVVDCCALFAMTVVELNVAERCERG